jgi:L-alanine-DL-glutamate epimerase-like enolase superfamily enzyme
MNGNPIVTKIELIEFAWVAENIGLSPFGHQPTYLPGATWRRTRTIMRMHTDDGIVGEVSPVPSLPGSWRGILGESALDRERIYNRLKLAGSEGLGAVDNCLWDIAGKVLGLPAFRLLGGDRARLPTHISTMNGALDGPLSTPESFADYAEEALGMGYGGFKIHPWPGGSIRSHTALVAAVGDRVGGRMDLMMDPFCSYPTFADALKVGWACDDYRYLWLEDPYADNGVSHFGHRKLRELIKTPLLQGEKAKGLEERVNLIIAGATDLVRGDPIEWGLTSTMKLAHAAEGLGLDIEMHGVGPVCRQAMAACRNSNYYELSWVHPDLPAPHPPIFAEYDDTIWAVSKDDGCVPTPLLPGLGVRYDWDWINAHLESRRVVADIADGVH